MKIKKVSFADFQSAIMAPGIIAGARTLNISRDVGIQMCIGEDPGFLTVDWKGEEVLIPLMNVKSVVIIKEQEPEKREIKRPIA